MNTQTTKYGVYASQSASRLELRNQKKAPRARGFLKGYPKENQERNLRRMPKNAPNATTVNMKVEGSGIAEN